ncbi:hypothetical protein V6N13_142236 [Hibiscus sabdariffa]
MNLSDVISPSAAVDPPDLGRHSDTLDSNPAPILSVNDASSAMEVIVSNGSDKNHAAATLPLDYVSTTMASASVSPSSYKDTLLASVHANDPVVDDIIDEDECSKYDYVKDTCPSTTKDADPTLPATSIVHNVPSKAESFGPWMMVERCQRRNNRKVASPLPIPQPTTVNGSHFNPIFEEDSTIIPDTKESATYVATVLHPPALSNMTTPSLSKSRVAQARGKDNSLPAQRLAQQRSPRRKQLIVSIQKLVNVQHLVVASSPKLSSLTSRRSSTLSSTRFAR